MQIVHVSVMMLAPAPAAAPYPPPDDEPVIASDGPGEGCRKSGAYPAPGWAYPPL